MTADAWLVLAQPGELVDGVLVEERASRPVQNEEIVGRLVDRLRDWATPRGGEVHGPGYKLVTKTNSGRKPNICVFKPNTTAPLLIVEVPSTDPIDQCRARLSVLNEYAGLGVPWYWIVSPSERLMESFSLDAQGGYALFHCASEGNVTRTGLPGLSVDLDALWTTARVKSP